MSVGNQLDPGPQMPAPAPAPVAKSSAGKGLGVAALVIGIVALCLCWVPIANNFAAVLGFIALVLGVISLIIASKKNGGKGLGIASTVIAVVSIVLVFVTQAAYVKALDELSATIEDASDGEVAASDEVLEQAQDPAQALGLGQSAGIGEYTVSVDAVNLEADKEIAAANPFNEKPEGQYVLVDLTTEFNGAEEGDPWIDLTVELVGSDSRIYSTTSSMAVTEHPATDVPTLTAGGEGSYQLAFDVPAAAVEDAKIRVTETLSFKDESGLWATK